MLLSVSNVCNFRYLTLTNQSVWYGDRNSVNAFCFVVTCTSVYNMLFGNRVIYTMQLLWFTLLFYILDPFFFFGERRMYTNDILRIKHANRSTSKAQQLPDANGPQSIVQNIVNLLV